MGKEQGIMRFYKKYSAPDAKHWKELESLQVIEGFLHCFWFFDYQVKPDGPSIGDVIYFFGYQQEWETPEHDCGEDAMYWLEDAEVIDFDQDQNIIIRPIGFYFDSSETLTTRNDLKINGWPLKDQHMMNVRGMELREKMSKKHDFIFED
jgi:hypothetical protein